MITPTSANSAKQKLIEEQERLKTPKKESKAFQWRTLGKPPCRG
jgi:hypothetical protein